MAVSHPARPPLMGTACSPALAVVFHVVDGEDEAGLLQRRHAAGGGEGGQESEVRFAGQPIRGRAHQCTLSASPPSLSPSLSFPSPSLSLPLPPHRQAQLIVHVPVEQRHCCRVPLVDVDDVGLAASHLGTKGRLRLWQTRSTKPW